MTLADSYFKSTLREILEEGEWSKQPRTHWSDGTKAHYKSVKQKLFSYNIRMGEFPIITYRKTALKGAFYDMEAIYIKQTNVIRNMHPSIQPWWEPFVVESVDTILNMPVVNKGTIGRTYGDTVKRYDLMNRLLQSMQHNPDSRRHIINLWQDQQMIDDPKALVPCAYLTEWSVTQTEHLNIVDLTLIQRSQDFLMTVSINPAQYVMLGMMVCNHLEFVTGKPHQLGMFHHHIQDVHIYDRHMEAAEYLLKKAQPSGNRPFIALKHAPKNFYDHTWEDFHILGMDGIADFPFTLEIAI